MSTSKIKKKLQSIADQIPDSASYMDAMHELYVGMKRSQGKQAADEGRVTPYAEVKRRFSK